MTGTRSNPGAGFALGAYGICHRFPEGQSVSKPLYPDFGD